MSTAVNSAPLGVSRPLWITAGWSLLALAGHGATLAITRAGKEVAYQSLLLPPELFGSEHRPAVIVLALQALLVAAGLVRHLPALARTAARHAPHGRWLLILCVLGCTGAHELWKSREAFYGEMAFAGILQAVALGNLVLAGRAAAQVVPERWWAWLEDAPPVGRWDPFAVAAAAWVAVVSWSLGGLSYEWMPHVPDEGVYLFHARYFAGGMLSVPVPAVPDAFLIDLTLSEGGRMISPVPPGWPAVLAFGVWLGLPWAVNPLLGGVAVLLVAAIVRRQYGPVASRWATLLMAASPWLLFVSMSLMTQNASLVGALVATYAVTRLRGGDGIAWAIVGGVAIGFVSWVRPLEGLIVALLMGFWCLIQRGVPAGWLIARSAVLTISTVAVGALVLPYNASFTGDPLYFPIMAYVDKMYAPGANDLGFGPNRGLGWIGLDPEPGHDLRDMILNTNLNVFAVNVELLGWACGSLLPIALIAFARRISLRDVWWLIAIVAVSGTHGLYWFSGGPDFGARYWYLVIAPCLILAARGALALGDTVEARWPGGRRGVSSAVVLACLSALLLFVPWRAVDKYWRYRKMTGEARTLADVPGIDGAIVLVHGSLHPDYGAVATLNPPDTTTTDKALFAWDRDLRTSLEVVDQYKPRSVWLFEGPSVTGGGYEKVAGPMDATQAHARLRWLWLDREEQEP